MTTSPTDNAIIFGALTLGLASTSLESWMAARPELDRKMLLVSVPHDLGWLALEPRRMPGTATFEGVDGLRRDFGGRLDDIESHCAYLLAEAPLEGVSTRHVWDDSRETERGELLFEAALSTRAAWLALDRVAPYVPQAVRDFVSDMNTFDGHVGLGWAFRAGAAPAQITTRRILFRGGDEARRIADAASTMMSGVLSDHAGAGGWPAFAASTIPKLRPGDAAHALDVRVTTHPDGQVEAVAFDFFRLPTRVALSVVQSFNLPVDELERFGNLQGALGVVPEGGQTTWVDRVRMRYARTGPGVELGLLPRA